MSALIQSVDLDAIAAVAFSNDLSIPLPRHADVVTYFPTATSKTIDGLGADLSTHSIADVMTFEDFNGMIWGFGHEAIASIVTLRTNGQCDLSHAYQSDHGLKIARRMYDGLLSSPWACRTILSPSAGNLEFGYAILMYGKILASEISRCVNAPVAKKSQENQEPENMAELHQHDEDEAA